MVQAARVVRLEGGYAILLERVVHDVLPYYGMVWSCLLTFEKQVHLFFHNRFHGLYTHRALDKVPNFICCAMYFASKHPRMFDREILYPDAFDHTDPFMRQFKHHSGFKPFNVDDWPYKRI